MKQVREIIRTISIKRISNIYPAPDNFLNFDRAENVATNNDRRAIEIYVHATILADCTCPIGVISRAITLPGRVTQLHPSS